MRLIENVCARAITWESGHEGLKKIFVINLIFIYVTPYARL